MNQKIKNMKTRFTLIILVLIILLIVGGLGSYFIYGNIISQNITYSICCFYWVVIFTYDFSKKFRNWCNKPLKKKNK